MANLPYVTGKLENKNEVTIQVVTILQKYKTVLKVVFASEEDGKRIIKDGITLVYQRFLNIHPDDFVKMNFCARCISEEIGIR